MYFIRIQPYTLLQRTSKQDLIFVLYILFQIMKVLLNKLRFFCIKNNLCITKDYYRFSIFKKTTDNIQQFTNTKIKLFSQNRYSLNIYLPHSGYSTAIVHPFHSIRVFFSENSEQYVPGISAYLKCHFTTFFWLAIPFYVFNKLSQALTAYSA